MTPLLVAGSSGELQSVHVINMLLEDSRVDGHARDDNGCSACVLAAKHVQGKIITSLLPTLHDAGDGDQRTTPEDVYTSVEDMMTYLQWLPTIFKKDNAPSVFPYPVGMTTGKEKSKWMSELKEELATDSHGDGKYIYTKYVGV